MPCWHPFYRSEIHESPHKSWVTYWESHKYIEESSCKPRVCPKGGVQCHCTRLLYTQPRFRQDQPEPVPVANTMDYLRLRSDLFLFIDMLSFSLPTFIPSNNERNFVHYFEKLRSGVRCSKIFLPRSKWWKQGESSTGRFMLTSANHIILFPLKSSLKSNLDSYRR